MMWQGRAGGYSAVGACLGVLLLHLLGLAEGNAQKRFLDEKLKDYDVNTWPNSEESGRGKRSSLPPGVQLPGEPPEATTVKVQMFINSFGSLNAANMDYSIDVFLRQHWNDPRLSFNNTGKDRFTITNPEMQKRIWKPDTYFNNVKDAEIHQVTMPNILLRLYSNGDVLYSMRVTLTLACSMEFENYPFDAQVCGSSISSYANTEDVITYEWVKVDPIQLPDELEIAQFDLLSHDTESYTQHFVTGNFSGLKVHFSLRRQNGYHVLQTYVPTILIVSISWVSFWLDPNAVPGRVSLGVTTLLTLTTLASGIRAQLPPVSYVKAIDVWIGMCMIMVFGALLEFTLVNWLANKKIVNPPLKIFKIPKAASDDVEDPASKTPKTYINHARAFDRLCRAFFPIAFFVFNLIYWPYYLIEQHRTLQVPA